MRKISRKRLGSKEHQAAVDDRQDERPRCIQGATITSWNGPPEIDLEALFAKPANGPSVTGAGTAPARENRREQGTVALSDGTQITFANPYQFKTVAVD